MASPDPIPDDPGRPTPDPRTPSPSSSPPPERTPARLEYHPPPTTVKREHGVGLWIAVAFFVVLIVVGLLFWSGVIKAG